MYFRCAQCFTCIRLDRDNAQLLARCPQCHRAHRLRHERVGDSLATRLRRVAAYARAERLDLALAHTVLLGLVPLDAAREWMEHADHARWTDPDPGFDTALRRGWLTREQARRRGDRVLYASRLMLDHGLSESDAFSVTDNRVSLARFLEVDTVDATDEPAPRRRGGLAFHGAALALLVGSVAAVTFFRSSAPETPAVTETVRLPLARNVRNGLIEALEETTEVRTDAQGRPVEIVGPRADAVLETFCRLEPGVEPVRVLPGDDEATAVFRRGGRDWSLALRRHGDDERWSVGNGVDPIAALAIARSR